MIVDCFARRIMAPFQGVLQVIRVGDGEAESVDGLHWVLYAAHPDILAHSGLSEVRFGTWTAREGLRRALVRGTAAGGLIERIGEPLIEGLQAFSVQTPFALQDRWEYWLLDAETARPLVLLDTRLIDEVLPPAEPVAWLPGQAAREQFGGLDDLEVMLARRAGRRPRAAWFERSPDGSGVDLQGRRLPASSFPRLMLTTEWPTASERRLAGAFIDWWAPALLQLQHLQNDERALLERAAARRALVLARLYRLYPTILDQALLRAARVQARLQSPGPSAGHYAEPFLWAD